MMLILSSAYFYISELESANTNEIYRDKHLASTLFMFLVQFSCNIHLYFSVRK